MVVHLNFILRYVTNYASKLEVDMRMSKYVL